MKLLFLLHKCSKTEIYPSIYLREYELRGLEWRLEWTTGILDWTTGTLDWIAHAQINRRGVGGVQVSSPVSETWSVGVEAEDV